LDVDGNLGLFCFLNLPGGRQRVGFHHGEDPEWERYTYGPGIDEPLVGQRQSQIFYYEADGLGSVTSLRSPTVSATNWFRYTARQFDSDTGLYYYRARYYDPKSGRFLSEDPLPYEPKKFTPTLGGIRFFGKTRWGYTSAARGPAAISSRN
jgi:RHS repeat-associated protein